MMLKTKLNIQDKNIMAENVNIIKEGFPAGCHILDRLDSNETLLVRERPGVFGSNVCICVKPKAIRVEEWIVTAIRIAEGYEKV